MEAKEAAQLIRDWMNATLKEKGWSARRWALKAQLNPSAVQKAVREDYEFVTSTKTLTALAAAAGVAPPVLGDIQPTRPVRESQIVPRFLEARYRVQAGHWFEMDVEEPPRAPSMAVLPDPRYAAFPQWLEEVVGDSVDLKVEPGRFVHVVDAIEMGYAAKTGDWVIVERRSDQGAKRERTIKQVEIGNGAVKLWPRSRNARWKDPIVLTAGARNATDVEVEIVGLVIGAYDADF